MESRRLEDSKNVKTSQAYFFEGFISFFEDFSLTITLLRDQLTFIVHFKRLGSRVTHDSFNQYVLFFSKQYTYCKTNAIYT